MKRVLTGLARGPRGSCPSVRARLPPEVAMDAQASITPRGPPPGLQGMPSQARLCDCSGLADAQAGLKGPSGTCRPLTFVPVAWVVFTGLGHCGILYEYTAVSCLVASDKRAPMNMHSRRGARQRLPVGPHALALLLTLVFHRVSCSAWLRFAAPACGLFSRSGWSPCSSWAS